MADTAGPLAALAVVWHEAALSVLWPSRGPASCRLAVPASPGVVAGLGLSAGALPSCSKRIPTAPGPGPRRRAGAQVSLPRPHRTHRGEPPRVSWGTSLPLRAGVHTGQLLCEGGRAGSGSVRPQRRAELGARVTGRGLDRAPNTTLRTMAPFRPGSARALPVTPFPLGGCLGFPAGAVGWRGAEAGSSALTVRFLQSDCPRGQDGPDAAR